MARARSDAPRHAERRLAWREAPVTGRSAVPVVSGGLEEQLAQLLADLAGLGVRLLDEVAGRDGEAVLDGARRPRCGR